MRRAAGRGGTRGRRPAAKPGAPTGPVEPGEQRVFSILVRSFGIGVRQLREAHGWSQERLAEQSNLNRSYVGEIERGRAIASLLTVEKLAAALKLTPSALLTRGEAISRMAPLPGGKLMAIAC
jgi:ribosome-binding protein aMBF1 (putative translation factor)